MESIGSFKRVFSESQIDISDGLMEMLVLREGNPIEIANMFLMMMHFFHNESYQSIS